MVDSKTNLLPKDQSAPQVPEERGLTDAKLQEIKHIGDPPEEQEQPDIM